MKEKIKIGYIGLGRRGFNDILKKELFLMSDVEITTICDLSVERIQRVLKHAEEIGYPLPKTTTDYRDILNDPEIDAVMIMTGWRGRPEIAKQSLLAGKYTAIEVGCTDTLEECYELLEAYQKTGAPLMMLENCCYGRREMMVLNMVKQGLFGELVHCRGGYHHYLNEQDLFRDIETYNPPHYRLQHYQENSRENYPTHELGPISKVLNINRGNRFVSLCSVASKACGLKHYAKRVYGEDSPYATKNYTQGDIVNTILTCENGETVLLTLDTTLPRAYYSRGFSVRGTMGMSDEEGKVVFLEGMEEKIRNNEEEMYQKYDHPLHAEYMEQGPTGGHGGMDWLVCRAFIESVKNGTQTPIDIYDTLTWLAVGVLSEQSIANNGAPVEFPDFTNGKWANREPVVECKYCLDKVCADPETPIFPE